MAIGLDKLTRAVNVRWGSVGAIFAAGAHHFVVEGGYIISGDVRNEDGNAWSTVSSIAFGQGGPIGSSFAMVGKTDDSPGQPIFVLIGMYIPSGEPWNSHESGMVIVTSPDGQNWNQAFMEPWTSDGTDDWNYYGTGIVWDGTSFWASCWVSHTHSDPDDPDGSFIEMGERLYASADGQSWSQAGENFSQGSFEDIGMRESALLQYCNKPENAGGVPDGVQGYDPQTGTLIKPSADVRMVQAGLLYDGEATTWPTWGTVGTFNKEIKSPSSQVEITRNEETTTGGVSGPCYGVAFAGGIWVACGGTEGSFVDVSFDSGETWENAFVGNASGMLLDYTTEFERAHYKFAALTICGGKRSDI